MKNFFLFFLTFAIFLFPSSEALASYVRGHYRSNGTYVNGYERTAPDGNPYNNYSFPGNYNPNTGKITGGNSDTYLRNYYDNSNNYGSYSAPYIPSIPTTPSCPFMSTYNSLTGSCECLTGYVADEYGSCTSGDTVCHKKYGYGSSYSSSSKSCSCDYGYRFDSNDQCVTNQTYCTNTFGYGAEYSYLKSSCICRSGYVVNSLTNKCELDFSSYTSSTPANKYTVSCPANSFAVGDSCYCSSGYKISEDKTSCVAVAAATVAQSACPLNAELVNGICQCNKTSVFNGSNCVKKPEVKSKNTPKKVIKKK